MEVTATEKTKISKNVLWAYGIVAFFVIVRIATHAYDQYYIYLSVYLWFGFVYGMCLQYGRFCFSSAFRDLFAVGVSRMVVGIMIASVLFALVGAFVSAIGLSTFHPAPSRVHYLIAGFILAAIRKIYLAKEINQWKRAYPVWYWLWQLSSLFWLVTVCQQPQLRSGLVRINSWDYCRRQKTS